MKRLLLLLALASAQPAVHAAAWPAKPLRAIVPVGAGSSTDIVHRLVLEKLSAGLGQPIVVENRVGAGGTIGTAAVAKAEADGYTLLASGSAHTIAPALYKSLPYDPARDFAPVVPLGISPSVLVVSPAKGIESAEALVAAAKAHPGALNFSSVGIGTATHLAAERFVSSAAIEAVHVPFKGGAEAMLEVIAGRVDFFFGPVALVLPHIRDGKLRALAVNGATRSSMLPEVPTLREAGYRDAEYPIWFGLFVPARTPGPIVEKLNHETLKALQNPALREKLSALGVDAMAMTPQEFKLHVEREIVLNARLAKAAGLKSE
ncbi:MAG TPA: tripartite tricarboxylate transporter substrate binding protein [Burkholderiales bacterium]|jgi:tripartite-type tricarboxylate transporter receptor subunit TctC|nr:tripartite tricarboxylate transporter substrate binding protein [Burkholderiales bacterium]